MFSICCIVHRLSGGDGVVVVIVTVLTFGILNAPTRATNLTCGLLNKGFNTLNTQTPSVPLRGGAISHRKPRKKIKKANKYSNYDGTLGGGLPYSATLLKFSCNLAVGFWRV